MLKQFFFFVVSFAIPALLKFTFAQQTPVLYACKGAKELHPNVKIINCNSSMQVIDAIQKQVEFIVESRIGFVYEYECGREYAYARRMKEENPSVLQQRAPKALAICNDAVSQIKK
jgi:hypothetical protein